MLEQPQTEAKREEKADEAALQEFEQDVLFSFRLLPYEKSFLERFASGFLRRRSREISSPQAEDPVHILTVSERDNINRIVRNTILRSMLAGIFSALIAAIVSIRVEGLPDSVRYSYIVPFAIVATLLEVSFLYWSHLHAMLALTQATGATMGSDEGSLADAMARAALELPDPTRIIEGINPRRETSRAGLIMAVALYKLKRGLTSFAFKFAIRQTATREVLKTFAPLIALPISGAWNAFVSFRILREARMRVLGPSAAEEMISNLLDDRPALSERAKSMLLRAVGVAMVRKRCAHPNLLLLLRTLVKRTGAVKARELDNPRLFLQALPRLTAEEQRLSLIVLQISFMIDGSLSRKERRFIIQSRGLCGLSNNLMATEELLHTFVSGAQIYPGMLEALARD
jgi:hypothetical protein